MTEYEMQTKNLFLKPIGKKDFEYFFETWNDSDFRKFLFDDKFVPPEMVDEQIEKSQKSFSEEKFGIWKLILRKSNKICGFSGLRYEPDMPRKIGLLYGIEKSYWGRGFAFEASLEILNYAFRVLKKDKIISLANPENTSSWLILEKLGMNFMEEIQTEIERLRVYELSAGDFLTNPKRINL